jgi:hypothetical protein
MLGLGARLFGALATWAASLMGYWALAFAHALFSFPLQKKSTFPSLTFTKVCFFSLNSKIRQTISLNFSNRAFYLPEAVLKAVLSFYFLFISAKSLKSHSKS